MKTVPFTISLAVRKGAWTLAAIGAVTLAAGFVVDRQAALSSALIAAYILLTLGLGGLVFVAFEYLTGAGWSVAFRRVPEALAATMWVSGLLMLGVVALQSNAYAWNPGEEVGTFWFKQLWLTPWFLFGRAVIYLLLWCGLAAAVIATSRRQDETRDIELSSRNRRWSALVLLIFAPTFTLASCDWFMSLEPMWFSTIWGVYHFAGLAMSTLAVVVLFSLYLRRVGPFRGVFRDDHLHDLGKLLFGFSCFWMYLWFSQYMLIWYAHIPEETSYFVPRTHGAWGPLLIANLALNWFIPFLVLLPRPSKRSGVIMARVAVVVLIGRWLDLYLMVYPSTTGRVVFGLAEVGAVVLTASVLCLLLFHALSRTRIVPIGDPLLPESLHLGAHHLHSGPDDAEGHAVHYTQG